MKYLKLNSTYLSLCLSGPFSWDLINLRENRLLQSSSFGGALRDFTKNIARIFTSSSTSHVLLVSYEVETHRNDAEKWLVFKRGDKLGLLTQTIYWLLFRNKNDSLRWTIDTPPNCWLPCDLSCLDVKRLLTNRGNNIIFYRIKFSARNIARFRERFGFL